MTKIFTKMGDRGETGRLDGARVPKNDPLIELNGALDECNSTIGVARSFNEDARLDGILMQFQRMLLGAEPSNTVVGDADIQALETLINELDAELPPLKNFILPAGGKVSAHLHLARTMSRKVERRLAALQETEEVNPILPAYFNRLSDTLFVLARHAARLDGGSDEVLTVRSPAQKPRRC